MSQENTLPVTAPRETEQRPYDVKKTDSSSSDQAYMFDKMNNVEEADFKADGTQNDTNSTASKKPSFYTRYQKFFQ